MIAAIFITIVLVGVAILGLTFKIFFIKGGKFPETHVSRSPHMKARGITCVKTYDRMQQEKYNPVNRFKGIRPVRS